MKINLEKLKTDPEEQKSEIKGKLNKHLFWMKIILLINEFEPISIKNITLKSSELFSRATSRATIKSILPLLLEMNLIEKKTIEDDVDLLEQHKEELKTIPQQFRKKFLYTSYYYLTDYGKEFVEFCAKKTGALDETD